MLRNFVFSLLLLLYVVTAYQIRLPIKGHEKAYYLFQGEDDLNVKAVSRSNRNFKVWVANYEMNPFKFESTGEEVDRYEIKGGFVKIVGYKAETIRTAGSPLAIYLDKGEEVLVDDMSPIGYLKPAEFLSATAEHDRIRLFKLIKFTPEKLEAAYRPEEEPSTSRYGNFFDNYAGIY